MHEVQAVVCLALGVVLLLALVSYVSESPGINHVGPVGYALANFLTQVFGLAAYTFPALVLACGCTLFANRASRISTVRVVGGCALLLVTSVGLGLARPHVAPEAAGGALGEFLAMELERSLGSGGSSVVLVSLGLFVFMMITGGTISDFLRGVSVALRTAAERGAAAVGTMSRRVRHLVSDAGPDLLARLRPRRLRVGGDAEPPPVVYAKGDGDPAPSAAPAAGEPKIRVELPGRKAREGVPPATDPQEEFVFDVGETDFRLPPRHLLGRHDDRASYVDERTLISQSKILEQKLATFGVLGHVTAVRPGPVITTYEFEPDEGVKVSRVVNLCDDLTMALRAHGVRIVAPIPGKNCVGIEVSNRNRAVVYLRDLIGADGFERATSTLTLALGRDTTGVASYADLGKMPHLLMAGATGTGKSVALNTYILSILYKATPRDVRFIMIDPKMLELALYEGIPHLLVPVVTDVKKAAAALKNVLREMERRFAMMKDKRVRHLDDYNARIAEEADAGSRRGGQGAASVEGGAGGVAGNGIAKPEIVHEHLPRLVVIVDELADLMMSVGREVEEAITRLAQKARAAGIHLIVATQRPSVDVITGLIKANFPSRISFQVTARPDSRTILDSVGAERLLGNGDLLFMAPGTSFLQRLHGAYISDRETTEIVDFLKSQGDPDYRMEMLESVGAADGGEEDHEFFDELYDRAVDLVTQHGQGSTSWLQRKLGIGYNRSARIMEHMEREGVVGPADGSKPRQVLAQAIET